MTGKNTSYPNKGTGYFFEENVKKGLTNRGKCAAALLILKNQQSGSCSDRYTSRRGHCKEEAHETEKSKETFVQGCTGTHRMQVVVFQSAKEGLYTKPKTPV